MPDDPAVARSGSWLRWTGALLALLVGLAIGAGSYDLYRGGYPDGPPEQPPAGDIRLGIDRVQRAHDAACSFTTSAVIDPAGVQLYLTATVAGTSDIGPVSLTFDLQNLFGDAAYVPPAQVTAGVPTSSRIGGLNVFRDGDMLYASATTTAVSLPTGDTSGGAGGVRAGLVGPLGYQYYSVEVWTQTGLANRVLEFPITVADRTIGTIYQVYDGKAVTVRLHVYVPKVLIGASGAQRSFALPGLSAQAAQHRPDPALSETCQQPVAEEAAVQLRGAPFAASGVLAGPSLRWRADSMTPEPVDGGRFVWRNNDGHDLYDIRVLLTDQVAQSRQQQWTFLAGVGAGTAISLLVVGVQTAPWDAVLTRRRRVPIRPEPAPPRARWPRARRRPRAWPRALRDSVRRSGRPHKPS